jgi:nucleotide-binding universal stress UspA family protein
MYGTTVVGWDASFTAENAIAWAVDRALRQPAGPRVLRVVRIVDDALAVDADERADWTDTATSELADLAGSLRDEHPDLQVESEVLHGEPGEVLAAQAGEDTLVVVGGENGRTDEYWYSARMGARVSGMAEGPVAVIPVGDDRARSGVMVAVDESAGAAAVCRFAAQLATERGEALHAVHVGVRTHDVATDQEILDRIIAPVIEEFPDLDVESHLESGGTVGALLRRAKERSVVVVGSRRVSAVRRLFLGSVSHALVTNAWCPTIVVPPRAQEPR